MFLKKLLNKLYEKYRLKKKNNIFDSSNYFGRKSSISSTFWGKYSGCNKNYVSIASNVIIGPRNHIFTNFTTHDFPYTKNEHGEGMF